MRMRTDHVDGVDQGGRRFRVDLLEELFVLFEGRQTVEQVVQHLRHVPPQRWIQRDATLRQLSDVLHHTLVAEVVRERLHPFRQELDHVRTKAAQFLLISHKPTFIH